MVNFWSELNARNKSGSSPGISPGAGCQRRRTLGCWVAVPWSFSCGARDGSDAAVGSEPAGASRQVEGVLP